MTIDLAKEMARLPEPADAKWPDWDYFRHEVWTWAQTEKHPTLANSHTTHHNFLSSWLPISPAWELVSKNLERYDKAMRRVPYEPGDEHGPYSRNLVKLTGWLSFWEQTTGRRVEDLDTIYEFGGGFGAMCYIIRKLGFTGRYAIYDFPEMQLLQRWYLESEGYTADFVQESQPCDLFIATTSFSETTREFRDNFPMQAQSYLFEWQEKWPGIDNREWFMNFIGSSHLQWVHLQEAAPELTLSVGW